MNDFHFRSNVSTVFTIDSLSFLMFPFFNKELLTLLFDKKGIVIHDRPCD